MNNLLIIDDNPRDRELLLSAVGNSYTTSCAANVRDAESKIRDDKPDAIILDLMIPGEEIASNIQIIERLSPDSAIIAYSGTSSLKMLGESVEAGADVFAMKSSGLESGDYLHILIAAAVRNRKRKRGLNSGAT